MAAGERQAIHWKIVLCVTDLWGMDGLNHDVIRIPYEILVAFCEINRVATVRE